MGDIYRNATKTLVWLGPEYNDSHNIIFQLVKIGHTALKSGKLTDLLKSVVEGGDMHQLMTEFEAQLSETFSQYLHDRPLALKFLNGYSSLLSRPYWSRVWIIQGFVVSPNVLLCCGRDEMSYSVWQPACMAIPFLRNYLLRCICYQDQQPKAELQTYFDELIEINIDATTTYALTGTRSIYQAQRMSLFSAICIAQIPYKPNAKDDRDLIFGLLGLTSDAVNAEISPDYAESTTCQGVYTLVSRFMIYQGDVDVLSLAQNQSNGLLSWVPDWRIQIYPPFGQPPTKSVFKVSGSAPFSLTINHDHLPKNQVKLLGYLLSTVELLGTKSWCPPYRHMIKTLRSNREPYLRSITTLCQKSDEKLLHPNKLPDPYPHPKDRASAEMNIPVSGMELYEKNLMLRHANNSLDDHTDFEKGFQGAMKATRLQDRGPYSKETGEYFQAMKLQRDRRGILLENARLWTLEA
jgi:hypothetical protein